MFINKNINYKSNKKLNNLDINSENKIYFSNKSNLMNSGIYIVNKKLNKFLKNKVNSFEDDILPNLINSNLVFGKIYKGKHFDIGTKKNITIFKKYVKNRN
jgi:NDP-sugar pyrophosphorylase family protein